MTYLLYNFYFLYNFLFIIKIINYITSLSSVI